MSVSGFAQGLLWSLASVVRSQSTAGSNSQQLILAEIWLSVGVTSKDCLESANLYFLWSLKRPRDWRWIHDPFNFNLTLEVRTSLKRSIYPSAIFQLLFNKEKFIQIMFITDHRSWELWRIPFIKKDISPEGFRIELGLLITLFEWRIPSRMHRRDQRLPEVEKSSDPK